MGDAVRPLDALADLSSLVLELRVNGVMRQRAALSDLMRDAATLWADVNAFQSMRPGDVLMLGTDCMDDGTRPRVHAGDAVEITATGFAPLVNHFVQGPPDAGPPQVGRAPLGGSEHASAPSVGVTSS